MKLWKKQGVLVLIMCMLLSVPYPGWIPSAGTVHAAVSFENGDGTLGNPFQIATAEQLNEIRNYPTSHFILINDIDLSSHPSTTEWEPIADFAGSLDGGGKKISNLKVDIDSFDVGLFANLLDEARIEFLFIEDAEIRGLEYVGILAGSSIAETNNVIHEVTVTGAVYGDQSVGGLIGRAENVTISNSSAEADVSGENSNAGGLIGQATDSTISYSYASGNVKSARSTGGLVGYFNSGEISYSFASGTIEGAKNTGGLIGELEASSVAQSYSTGNVIGVVDAGGLIGGNRHGDIFYSFATGDVSGCDDIGGLVGDNDRAGISNGYAAGNVIGTCGGSNSIGGLVGDNSGSIVNSFVIGTVTGDYNVGGLAGDGDSGSVVNSYHDMDLTGQPDHDGQGLTSEQMKNKDNYEDWDFLNIWKVDQHHNGYPYLVGMQEMLAFITYLVNDSNDNNEFYESKSYRIGSSVEINDLHLTKAEHFFQGWNTEPDGSGTFYEAGHTIQLNSDLLLYATWQPILSSNTNLGSLQILAAGEELVLSPAFSTEETSYRVETTSSEVTIRATASDAGATITLDSEELDGEGIVVLDEGDNAFEIIVKAEEGSIKTYDLTVHRIVEREETPTKPETWQKTPKSNNAQLANLIVTIDGEKPALSPVLSSEKTNYRLETMSSEVIIEAIPAEVWASVTLDGEELHGEETVVLLKGDNVLEIVVQAEDGTSKLYRLTIHRIATSEITVCTFNDVKGHWAERLICEAFERGIVNGQTEMNFSPESSITRVEFVALLVRTLGMTISDFPRIEHRFVDWDQIPAWALSTVQLAMQKGILQGYPDHSLRPLDHVSRAEMVTMMGRAVAWEISQRDTTFHDNAEIPNWAKGYIQEAVARGIVSGHGNNRFSPSESATRAEATVLLIRLWHALDELQSEDSDY